MQALYFLIDTVFTLYIWAIIISIVISWLVAFGIINTHNQFVYNISYALNRITEPALRPIRNLLPDLGGIDISPIILIIALQFLKVFILHDILLPLM
ncbi:YggT family protein [Luteithermobacter gelatinilyticus]|uniref:YggT family protein n=1 Tax=Luteithermobacter gelatinilyticus TaxID=2582913 RepID=UPI00110754A7|nr:YggT family protein [Luteithermobacter gelatinilyticus]|tara:strand:+ start:23256 stop:23546 length:291 start_codon:yes stop_codon:yes gene_type:complete